MRNTSHRESGRLGWIPILILLVAAIGAVSAQAAVLINEVDADTPGTDMLEFIELYGTPNEALDGLVVVMYNGNGDVSYGAYDLDGFTLDANGFFLLGNTDVVPTPSIIFASNGVQNGADAVALYTGNGTDFPTGTAVTATNLIDALVYDTDDADDTGLLGVLTPGQPQINEFENGTGTTDSMQRIPDGGGGALVTTSYVVQAPTPGVTNGGILPQPPQVTNVYHRSLLPIPGEAVTVYADATDSDGTISSVTLYYQLNGGGFTTTPMTLDSGDTYTGALPSNADGTVVDYYVEATDNDMQTATNPADAPVSFYSYTVAPELVTPIAFVHADSAGYDGTTIMVQGQVYIPGNYQADGTSVSAYVQDASGRGLNIFGTYYSTGMDLLNDTSNIVKVSGRVDYYYTTLELVNYEVELVSTGNPVLTPTVKTTAAAALPINEGTYTGTTGNITAIATTGGGNPAYNFTVTDGSGDVVIRIDEDIAAGMDTWLVGDELVAA
ncbi:lamin tail domain-containing protein, partial [bacterium]|nr:lamin tail domain-containing protein [bacterium]